MSWDAAPGWLALVVSVGAAWIALLARKDTKRSADADEAAVRLQQEDAAERRQAALPRPRLVLERQSTNLYTLRNVGTGPASGVRILPEGLPEVARDLPVGLTLAPEAGHQFVLAGSIAPNLLPTHLKVTWDGLAEPVTLRLEVYP